MVGRCISNWNRPFLGGVWRPFLPSWRMSQALPALPAWPEPGNRWISGLVMCGSCESDDDDDDDDVTHLMWWWWDSKGNCIDGWTCRARLTILLGGGASWWDFLHDQYISVQYNFGCFHNLLGLHAHTWGTFRRFILKQPRWFYGISSKYIVTAAILIQDTYFHVELLRCILTEYQYDRQALLLEDSFMILLCNTSFLGRVVIKVVFVVTVMMISMETTMMATFVDFLCALHVQVWTWHFRLSATCSFGWFLSGSWEVAWCWLL